MDIQKKLEKVLDNYIKQTKRILSKYDSIKHKKNSYQELLELLSLNYDEVLNNKNLILVFLNSIYENSEYSDEFQRIISTSNPNQFDITEFITRIVIDNNKLQQEIEFLELEISETEELKLSAQRVKNSLKYHKPVMQPEEDINNIEKILMQLQNEGAISNKEEILFINELTYYNEILLSKKDLPEEKEITEILYNEITNIVSAGFQEFDIIEVSPNKKSKLDGYAREIVDIIKDSNEEKIEEIFENYKKYNLETNEYSYIIVKVLEEFTEELITLSKLLLDKDIYRDKESVLEIVKNYYDLLNRYIIVQKYYNSEMEYMPDENDLETSNVDYKGEKRFIFSHSNTNITKARLISDMTDIPYEYYDRVYDLMTRFKNGTIGTKEFKALTSHRRFKGHVELRYDQVRIVLKHVKDNIYNVLGVFAKKANNDMTMYGRIINRMIPDVDTDKKLSIQLELAEHTEEELEKLVKSKARKGTR